MINNIKFKQLTLSLFFVMVVATSYSQEASKFKFRSVSLDIGYFESLGDNDIESDFFGICFNADVGFSLNNIILSAYFDYGLDVGFLGIYDQSYFGSYLTIGKEWMLNDWLGVEGHIGAGYILFNTSVSINDNKTSGEFGVPLRLKGNIYFSDHFSLVLNPSINFNTFTSSILALSIGLQYKI
ncbi:hypothetical protein [Aestuariivivens insulae]|uniref:hypothetical protein n=1 Tax=Aestuariivivens insulae TaxID=1621988 RepID=UPI001F56E8BA|nr:hypothetical protein [Aestuariivivens insulae]